MILFLLSFKYDETGQASGSFPVKPDGFTGGTTMKALVMAVQINYNLSPVDGVWGNNTTSACKTIDFNTTDKILIRILQGGFYCKGYDAGGFDGGFDGGFGPKLKATINLFKEDLGITQNSRM